jgi:hypothetical protein
MTLVRRVDADGPLRPGLGGSLMLAGGVRVAFDVLEVNDLGPSWTRQLHLGPVRLFVDHHVDEGFGLVEIAAPFPIALAYVPFARRSLSCLLRRG